MKKRTLFNEIIKALILLVIGGAIYYVIEIAWDGSSHWSMAVTGGTCFLIGDLLDEFKGFKLMIRTEVFIISAVITVLEFLVGVVVNLILHLDVWDYSSMYLNIGEVSIPMHIMGQVSIPFVLLWTFIFAPFIIFFGNYLRWELFDKKNPMKFIEVYKSFIFGREYEASVWRRE